MFKQTPERLYRLARSFAAGDGEAYPRVDAAVFLDGPYRGLSDDLEYDVASYHAIADACEEGGVQWAIFPPEIYEGEPAKRTAAAVAAFHYPWAQIERRNEAMGQERWLVVIDSDEFFETPVDWSIIEQQGTGTITLRNWNTENGELVPDLLTPGTGAKMIRMLPLLPGLVWGPSHFDVMDIHTGITFLGHEKGLTATNEPCAVFGHDVGVKTIAEEYMAYNEQGRVEHEGRLLRISEIADDGSYLVVRMDRDQATAQWRVGFLASFAAEMMPEGHPAMRGVLTGITDTDLPKVVELRFERRTDEEVDAMIARRKELDAEQAERDAKILAKRKLKQEQRRRKQQRIVDSQIGRRR